VLERFLFGSDFPTLIPSMAVGTVEKDPFLTEKQKQAIFYDNAKKLLKI
jgi:predicted TIM-barrel fold metal-dependent hydrolase